MRFTGSFHTIVTHGVSGATSSLISGRSTSAGATLTGHHLLVCRLPPVSQHGGARLHPPVHQAPSKSPPARYRRRDDFWSGTRITIRSDSHVNQGPLPSPARSDDAATALIGGASPGQATTRLARSTRPRPRPQQQRPQHLPPLLRNRVRRTTDRGRPPDCRARRTHQPPCPPRPEPPPAHSRGT